MFLYFFFCYQGAYPQGITPRDTVTTTDIVNTLTGIMGTVTGATMDMDTVTAMDATMAMDIVIDMGTIGNPVVIIDGIY